MNVELLSTFDCSNETFHCYLFVLHFSRFEVKYLGITVDENLTWNGHYEKTQL